MNRLRPWMLTAALALVAGLDRSLTVVAQTSPAAPANESPAEKLEPFVITGSYIPSTETAVSAGPSPLLSIDRKAIEESGATGTAELLQKITVANANAVPISNNATGFTPGAATVSLRGLGSEATLVLINGRRVAMYPVGVGGSTAFVDLNSIPLAALEKIEVLKDGASALYGADAVAGVINLKLRRGMDGSEVTSSYGNTTDRDASEITVNLATGVMTGKVSAIVGLNYFHKGGIQNSDRDYSQLSPRLSANASPMNLELSRFAIAAALGQSVLAPIRGVPNNAVYIFAQSGADAANNGTRPASQYTYSLDRSATYNPNESATSYPEIRRLGATLSGERKLFSTDHVKAYVDLSYQRSSVEYQLAPSPTGDFTTPGQTELVIPARTANPILTVVNPFLGAIAQVPAGSPVFRGEYPGPGTKFVNGTVQRLAAPGAVNPFNPYNQDIADDSRGRLADFGNRVVKNDVDAALAAVGVKGENLFGRWNFDLSYSYSAIREETRNRLHLASRFNEMVNANSPIFDPRNAAYIGTSTAYNPFGYYRNPPAGNLALESYARVTASDENESSLGQLNGVVSTRDLATLPYGSVGLAFGGDFRHEQLDQNPSPYGLAGDLIGFSPSAVTRAQRKIGGVFVETRLPVLPRVEINASARHERFFSSDRQVTVPKVALRWQPVAREVTVRTSYSEGFREPSLFELHSSPISVLTTIFDPRDNFVENEQRVTLRGNRRLEAEKTDYFNAGFIWTPTRPSLKGLTLAADYWAVSRDGTVESNPQYTVYRAFGLLPGGLQPGESVILSGSGAISAVNAIFYNVGQTRVKGWDFSGSYAMPTDRWGRWELSTIWTMMSQFKRSAVEGAPRRHVLGTDSTGVGADAYLKWRGRVNLNWAYRGFTVFAAGTYTDGFSDFDLAGNPFEVGDRFLIDGQVSYAFRSARPRSLRDSKLTLGVRNLFDWDPPQAYGNGGNTTGYPGALYTAEGRFLYVSASKRF